MPGPTSKASRDLAQVRFQLKTGKTRKGRPLEPEEITALEEKRDRMVAEMRAERQKKAVHAQNEVVVDAFGRREEAHGCVAAVSLRRREVELWS